MTPAMYPVNAFPKAVREAILEVEGNLKAPRPLIAMSFISAMSAAAQAKIKVIHPLSGQLKPATIFLFVVANSGERKSSVDRLVSAPLHTHDEASEAWHKKALLKYNNQHHRWKSVRRELERRLTNAICNGQPTENLSQQLDEHEKGEPTKPRLRRLVLQDVSERALHDILEGEGESVAIICDEGEIVLRSPLLTKHGAINKAWDGGTLVLNRGNGVNISARDPRVTLSIMAQQSVLKDFLRKRGEASRGTGFFSRFLMAWPESTQGYRFNHPNNEITWEHLSQFHSKISEMLPDASNDLPTRGLTQRCYELDDDAKDIFTEIVNRVESMIQPMQYLNDIHDSASKIGENVIRVAALLHHFSDSEGKISRDTIERAHEIVAFHVNQFKRIFSPDYEQPPIFKDTESIVAYLHRIVWSQGYWSIPRTDVHHSGPVRDYARFGAAIQNLQAQGIIFLKQVLPSKKVLIDLNIQYFRSLPPLKPRLGGTILPV